MNIQTDSTGKQYKVINQTFYHIETEDSLIPVIESLRASQTRVKLYYGDTSTGIMWGDKQDDYYGSKETGRMGRSTGPSKIPLAIYSRRSLGGPALLTHCILKIVTTQGNRVLYTHPNLKA